MCTLKKTPTTHAVSEPASDKDRGGAEINHELEDVPGVGREADMVSHAEDGAGHDLVHSDESLEGSAMVTTRPSSIAADAPLSEIGNTCAMGDGNAASPATPDDLAGGPQCSDVNSPTGSANEGHLESCNSSATDCNSDRPDESETSDDDADDYVNREQPAELQSIEKQDVGVSFYHETRPPHDPGQQASSSRQDPYQTLGNQPLTKAPTKQKAKRKAEGDASLNGPPRTKKKG